MKKLLLILLLTGAVLPGAILPGAAHAQTGVNIQKWAGTPIPCQLPSYPWFTCTPTATKTVTPVPVGTNTPTAVPTNTPSHTPTPIGYYTGSFDSLSDGVTISTGRAFFALGITSNLSNLNSTASTIRVFTSNGVPGINTNTAFTVVMASGVTQNFNGFQQSSVLGASVGPANIIRFQPVITPTQTIVYTYYLQLLYGPLTYKGAPDNYYALYERKNGVFQMRKVFIRRSWLDWIS